MTIEIVSIGIDNEIEMQKIVSYLAPHETEALFLLGNIKNELKPAFLYIAKDNGKIVGVCGYYPLYKSCTIFSESAVATKEFAKMLIDKYEIEALLGMSKMVQPAYDIFVKHGLHSENVGDDFFFELDMQNFKPYFVNEGKIRTLEEKDVDTVVVLHRQIHHIPKEKTITNEERKRALASAFNIGLEIDGKIVAIASSNGMAIKAFQILGVSTDLHYQRRGFAKTLCSYIIEHMRSRGAEKAILFTRKENTAANNCYLSLGFKITDEYCVALFKK